MSQTEPISRREREVLQLICDGLTNVEIACKLGIDKGTVANHRKNIMRKLGCKNTALLVRRAIENELVV